MSDLKKSSRAEAFFKRHKTSTRIPHNPFSIIESSILPYIKTSKFPAKRRDHTWSLRAEISAFAAHEAHKGDQPKLILDF